MNEGREPGNPGEITEARVAEIRQHLPDFIQQWIKEHNIKTEGDPLESFCRFAAAYEEHHPLPPFDQMTEHNWIHRLEKWQGQLGSVDKKHRIEQRGQEIKPQLLARPDIVNKIGGQEQLDGFCEFLAGSLLSDEVEDISKVEDNDWDELIEAWQEVKE